MRARKKPRKSKNIFLCRSILIHTLNEMVQCGFALHILDIDITAGLT